MKILVLSFALLTLFLSSSPCCTEEDTCGEKAEINCQDHSDDEEHQSELPCSPFYSCGTCSGFNKPGVFKLSGAYFSENVIFTSYYLSGKSEGFSIIPFKPPKQI